MTGTDSTYRIYYKPKRRIFVDAPLVDKTMEDLESNDEISRTRAQHRVRDRFRIYAVKKYFTQEGMWPKDMPLEFEDLTYPLPSPIE